MGRTKDNIIGSLIVVGTIFVGIGLLRQYKPDIYKKGVETVINTELAIRRELKNFIPLTDDESVRSGKYFCKRTKMEDNMPSKANVAGEEDTVSVCKNDEGEFTGRGHSFCMQK